MGIVARGGGAASMQQEEAKACFSLISMMRVWLSINTLISAWLPNRILEQYLMM